MITYVMEWYHPIFNHKIPFSCMFCLFIDTGCAFGGFKSRTEVPGLVEQYMKGDLPIEPYITHEFQGVESIDEAMSVLHEGQCLRAVVKYFS